MSNPVQIFTWGTGNYISGGSPWNGQPALVAPAGKLFYPNVKLPAENLNYVLGEIQNDITQLYANGPVTVASLTAFRALPVPAYNGSVICTPENTGQSVSGLTGVQIGGEYYYDSALNVVDNGSTVIRPNAITIATPGRWRLKGNTVFTVFDTHGDTTSNSYSASRSSAGTSSFTATGPGNFSYVFTTGNSPGSIYLNDIFDLTCDGYMEGTSTSASVFWARGVGSTTPLVQ